MSDATVVDKAWSEEAREAALEARRAHAHGKPDEPPKGRRPAAEEPTGGKRPANVEEYTPSSDKAARAKEAYVSANYEEQKIADEQERIISTALGMPRTPDNHAWDLLSEKHGIGVEIKTLVKQKNDKITMSKEARLRKVEWMESAGKRFKAFTLVADKRGTATRYYVRQGVGSFRIGSMQPITLQGMRAMLRSVR